MEMAKVLLRKHPASFRGVKRQHQKEAEGIALDTGRPTAQARQEKVLWDQPIQRLQIGWQAREARCSSGHASWLHSPQTLVPLFAELEVGKDQPRVALSASCERCHPSRIADQWPWRTSFHREFEQWPSLASSVA